MSLERRGRQQKIDDARDALRLVQQVIEHSPSSDPTLKRVMALMAQHLGCDEYQAASLLENAGIQEPLRIHLTDQRVKRFVRACRTDLQLTPLPEGLHQDKPRPATSTQRAAAAVLASFLQQLDADPPGPVVPALPHRAVVQRADLPLPAHRHPAGMGQHRGTAESEPALLEHRPVPPDRHLLPSPLPPPVPIADLDQYRNPDMESPDGYGRKRKKAAKAPATTAALASFLPTARDPQTAS